jgi:hypothetical protein
MDDRPTLVRAFEDARAAGDIDAMASAALALAAHLQFGVHLGRVPAYLHQAYSLATGVTRIRLAVALARTWAYGYEPTRAVPFAAEAVAAAASLGDPTLLAEALDASLLTHWGADDLAARLEITARLEDTVAHLADVEARLSSHLWRLTTALESLDAITVQRQLRALDDLADESGSARVRFFAVSRRAMHALVVGDLVAVRTFTAATVSAGEAAGEVDTPALQHELTAAAALQADDRAALLAEAESFEEFGTAQAVVSIMAEAALLWLAAGEPARARALLDRVGGGWSTAARDVDWLLTVAVLTEVAAGTGALDFLEPAVALLTPYAGRGVVNAGAVRFLGVVDDYLRLACEALGRDAGAAAWAASAALAYQRLGATWWLRRLELPERGVAHLVAGADGVWSIGPDGRTAAVREMKGFQYLRLLLERPGAEVSALDLTAAVSGHAVVVDPGFETADRQALSAYRRRIAELDEELAEAQSWADGARIAALTAERGMLLDEVGAATGLSGRTRVTGGSNERARVAVQKSLAAAIKRIAEVDEALGRLLRDTVRTGSACAYEPDPSRPIRWVLQ